MLGIGWDEWTVLGVLGVLLFDEKRAAQAWKWWRSTRAKMVNLKTDFEQKITDTVHETIGIQGLAEQNTPILNLRKQVRFRLENLDDDSREQRSARLVQQLTQEDFIQKSQIMAAFYPLAKEPNLIDFLQSWIDAGKKLLLPKVDPDTYSTHLYHIQNLNNDLCPGAYGILEPNPDFAVICTESPDFFLVPGLVFGTGGERLGKGKGYYDRLLANFTNVRKYGVAFEMQVFNTYIPQNLHDIPMDDLITETGIRRFESTRNL